MKILAVCTSAKVYGAETVLLSLLEGLQQSGHEVLAITSRWTDGQFPAQLSARKIAFHALPLGMVSKNLKWPYPWWSLQTLLSLPSLWWQFRRWRKRLVPDLVLVSSVHQILPLWFVLGRAPVLMVTQFCPNAGDARSEKLWRFVNRKITAWLACSNYIKRRLASLGVPPSHVEVVHSATLLELPELDSTKALAKNILILGIIGQIGAWKGHEDLVLAAGILHSQGYQFGIHIFGEGDAGFKEQLKALARDLKIWELITWRGYVRDKHEIFETIDICVVPSRFDDPYPTVVMEAASFGVPVVGTTRGGLPELIPDGETGFLVPAKDPVALADRLGELLQNPDLRNRQSLAAQTRAATVFQRSRMVADFSNAVRKLSNHTNCIKS